MQKAETHHLLLPAFQGTHGQATCSSPFIQGWSAQLLLPCTACCARPRPQASPSLLSRLVLTSSQKTHLSFNKQKVIGSLSESQGLCVSSTTFVTVYPFGQSRFCKWEDPAPRSLRLLVHLEGYGHGDGDVSLIFKFPSALNQFFLFPFKLMVTTKQVEKQPVPAPPTQRLPRAPPKPQGQHCHPWAPAPGAAQQHPACRPTQVSSCSSCMALVLLKCGRQQDHPFFPSHSSSPKPTGIKVFARKENPQWEWFLFKCPLFPWKKKKKKHFCKNQGRNSCPSTGRALILLQTQPNCCPHCHHGSLGHQTRDRGTKPISWVLRWQQAPGTLTNI